MKLLMEGKSSQSVFIASSFFYTKLSRSGLKGVKRWMRDVRLVERVCLLIFFSEPVLCSGHVLAEWLCGRIHLLFQVDFTKLGLFIVPVHLPFHWCLAAVHIKRKVS